MDGGEDEVAKCTRRPYVGGTCRTVGVGGDASGTDNGGFLQCSGQIELISLWRAVAMETRPGSYFPESRLLIVAIQ